MDNKLIVSSSPHINSPVKTKNIMIDVIIALIPAYRQRRQRACLRACGVHKP